MKRKITTILLSISLIVLNINGSIFAAASVCAATREECIAVVISSTSLENNEADESVLKKYKDAKVFMSEQFRQYVCTAIDKGIIHGYEDGTLRLNQEVTRAEFACMLYRAKDYLLNLPVKSIDYNGDYEDLSEWNKKEIYYCIENGYLIGYGDKFGSSDIITGQQLNTLIRRMSVGLPTREKYSWLEVCGVSPIPFSNMLMSAYEDNFLKEILPARINEKVINENSEEISLELEKLLEIQGNMDYEKLEKGSYKNFILDNFKGSGYAGATHINIIEDGYVTSIEEKISTAQEDKIKRESIFVISPLNNKTSSMYTSYNRTVGVGYEYYCYQETNIPPKNGETIGKWYKRRVDIDYIQYKTYSSPYAELVCKYDNPEEI